MQRSTRIVLSSIAFSVLLFAATCWSTTPKGTDPSANKDQYCEAFKVGMNQQQVQAVLDRYGPPYVIRIEDPELRVVEGEMRISSRYGTCRLVVDRNGIVSSVVTRNKRDAFRGEEL